MQTYELLSRSGKVFWTGCVICTGGGCNVVRWINHPAVIVAKLFERSLRFSCVHLVCRFLLFCFLPSKGVGGIQNRRKRFIPVGGRNHCGSCCSELLFVWHSDLLFEPKRELFPLPFFLYFHRSIQGWGGWGKKKNPRNEYLSAFGRD